MLSDFRGLWHPDIMTSKLACDGGTVTRHFTGSDGGTYTERLTYLSHSDRNFRYILTSGIPGIEGYGAKVSARPHGRKTEVTWSAVITGPKARITAVARGSEAIFARGLDVLATAKLALPVCAALGEARIERRSIGTLSCLVNPLAAATPDVLVLFLHGIGGQAENWRGQLKAFGHRFPVAALDMRGYGDSALGLHPASADDLCDDILRVLEELVARRVVLVGLSLGAWLATSFAMRHPDRLAGLVLAGGCTGMSEAKQGERKAFLTARLTPLSEGKTPADFAPEVTRLIAGPRADRAVKRALKSSMAAIPADAYRDALITFANPEERFDFKRIPCPVLLMTGSHDRLAPPQEIRNVAERMFVANPDTSDVRFEELPRTGHVCNLENPEAFNRHLDAFLTRTLAPASRKPRVGKGKAKHQRILSAALTEFAAASFSGASMDRIAKAADTSKPTLYRHFGNKEKLFMAVLNQGRARILTPLDEAKGAMVDQLWDFAWTYTSFVLRPETLSLARLILGEAERHPKHAALYHDTGPGEALKGIATYLTAQKASGALVFDDAETAAQDLWSLILSGPRDFHLHHPDARPDRAALNTAITRGLATFLRAYAVRPKPHIERLEKRSAALRKRLAL